MLYHGYAEINEFFLRTQHYICGNAMYIATCYVHNVISVEMTGIQHITYTTLYL